MQAIHIVHVETDRGGTNEAAIIEVLFVILLGVAVRIILRTR